MTTKRIHLHEYKTGLIKRFGYYHDLRSVSCAKALLEKFGWKTSQIREVKHTGEYYIFAQHRRPHKPFAPLTNGYIIIGNPDEMVCH